MTPNLLSASNLVISQLQPWAWSRVFTRVPHASNTSRRKLAQDIGTGLLVVGEGGLFIIGVDDDEDSDGSDVDDDAEYSPNVCDEQCWCVVDPCTAL